MDSWLLFKSHYFAQAPQDLYDTPSIVVSLVNTEERVSKQASCIDALTKCVAESELQIFRIAPLFLC